MIEIDTEKIPIKMWIKDIEDGALEQVKHLANLPFAFFNIAIMPDCHQGFGMPIGGVMATTDVVIPNAVGVDIGCGMRAMETCMSVEDLTKEKLVELMKHIRKNIPVGFSHNKEAHIEDMPTDDSHPSDKLLGKPIVKQQYGSATHQIGTLGGGNHFIEIQKDEEDMVWIMIHSGSRNLGYTVARYYNDIAKKLNKDYHSVVPKDWDLAFLPLDSEEAKAYFREMNYCLEFAKANRARMMRIIDEKIDEMGYGSGDELDIHHNYAVIEKHFGRQVVVHRKGATSAREGELGIIPGSQGTASYIVKGKGNMFSFNSCSHGAGRKMGRNVAKRTLDLKKQQELLNKQGIMHSVRTVNDLDEAPGAYKDIEDVMANQTELVDIIVKLKPIAVVKG